MADFQVPFLRSQRKRHLVDLEEQLVQLGWYFGSSTLSLIYFLLVHIFSLFLSEGL